MRLMAQRYVSGELDVRQKMLGKAGLCLASFEQAYRQGVEAFKRPSRNDDRNQRRPTHQMAGYLAAEGSNMRGGPFGQAGGKSGRRPATIV